MPNETIHADQTELPEKSTLAPETAPENAHEPSTGDARPGFLGKISDALSGVAERHGVRFKKGKGRPRKDGSPGAADVVIDDTGKVLPAAAVPALAAAAAADSPAAHSLFHRSIVSAVRGIIGGLHHFTASQIRRADLDTPIIRQALETAKPETTVVADFSEALEIVLKKRNVNTENAPEVALAILSAQIISPYALILLEVRAEIARKNAGVIPDAAEPKEGGTK